LAEAPQRFRDGEERSDEALHASVIPGFAGKRRKIDGFAALGMTAGVVDVGLGR
jgi:hypothetical protein